MECRVGNDRKAGGASPFSQSFQIFVSQSQCGDDPQVHKVLLVVIHIKRVLHVRRRHAQPGQKPYRKKVHYQEGEELLLRVKDLPDRICQKPVPCAHPTSLSDHHSICSTGTGSSLISSLSTFPFRMWITLSAIGVSARLCVMTMTVIPFSLQVFCRSARICLPVT